MAKVQPKSHLLFFTGTECDHCHEMEPLIEKLEKETGVTVERFEVWHNADNAALLKEYDKDFCGGIPFFYNTKTDKWICGPAEYKDFEAWAAGK